MSNDWMTMFSRTLNEKTKTRF